MRIILFSVFLLLGSLSRGQKNNVIVKQADNVIFKSGSNGVINITKADTVLIGQVIINQGIKSKLKIKNYSQQKDSSGSFTTIIKLLNQESATTFDVNLIIKFDKPVASVYWSFTGAAMAEETGNTADKKQYLFKAGQLTCADGLEIIIKSNEKVFTIIYGVDGIAN